MQVMKMVLTVQGTSQVPVYSGWVFSWVPLSFLGSSNVSLRSRLYLQCTQSPIQLLLEVWALAMYRMSDLTQVFKTEMELAVVSVVQKLDCSINWRGVSASFMGLRVVFTCFRTHSSPQFVVPILCSFLYFTRLTSSPTSFFFTNEKRKLMWQTFPN